MLRLLALILLAGCTATDSDAPEVRYQGELILFNFFGRQALVSIDGEGIYSGTLDVSKENESTGLSLAVNVTAKKCSDIEIVHDGSVISDKICPDKDGFRVFINPDMSPQVNMTYDKGVGLD